MSDADNGSDDFPYGPFDPGVLRFFSILPDEEDEEEHWCNRHQREMEEVDGVFHTGGELFSTRERFTIFTCPGCWSEVDNEYGEGLAPKMFKKCLGDTLEDWKSGEVEQDWFVRIGDGEVDEEKGMVYFD